MRFLLSRVRAGGRNDALPRVLGQDADPAGGALAEGGQGLRRELRGRLLLRPLPLNVMVAKAEHRTSLLAGREVDKTHPRIELRGRLDELNARIILVQIAAREAGNAALDGELEEVRRCVTALMACEARDAPCGELSLWGLDQEEIHQRSHSPERHYGLAHILPHPDMGRWAAELNLLRTLVRGTELCACRAFDDGGVMSRPDIVKTLNRLSSALYILTYKYLPEGYDRVIGFTRKNS